MVQQQRNFAGQLNVAKRTATEQVQRELSTLQIGLVSLVKKAGLQKRASLLLRQIQHIVVVGGGVF